MEFVKNLKMFQNLIRRKIAIKIIVDHVKKNIIANTIDLMTKKDYVCKIAIRLESKKLMLY